jgi:hypothetical protein
VVDALGDIDQAGRDWNDRSMAHSTPTSTPDLIIDLTSSPEPPTGHRLAELVQALTGCTVERAELAVSDPTPSGPASSDEALQTMARALVRLRSRQPATR